MKRSANSIQAAEVSWDDLAHELPTFDFEGRVTNAQWFERSREFSPEQKLLLNFGIQAFHDAYSLTPPYGINAFSRYKSQAWDRWQRVKVAAFRWIESEEEGPFSFHHWCEEFGFHPEWARRKLAERGERIEEAITSFKMSRGCKEERAKGIGK